MEHRGSNMKNRRTKFRRLVNTLFSKPQSQRQAVRRRRLWIAVLMRLAVVVVFILLLTLIISGFRSCSRHRKQKAAEKAALEEAKANSGDATIGFTGCMILHSPILDRYVDENGTYDFSEPYQYIQKYYEKPDIMVCEMEGTISDEANGYFGHPLFRYPAVISQNLADAGIDLQLLATNHIYDGKGTGLQLTLDAYENSGLAYAGIRKNKEEKRWKIVEAGPIKIGIVDYTYGTPAQFNAINVPVEDAELINMFSETSPGDFYLDVEEQVADMKEEGADFIIYALHWGAEYEMEPSDDQKTIAQQLCNRGVDAIIGGHPHVEQPIDVLQSDDGAHKMFCIYSVGNAFSNQRMGNAMNSQHCEDGLILTFKLHKDLEGKVTFKDIALTPTWVWRADHIEETDEEEDAAGTEEAEEIKEENSEEAEETEEEPQATGYDYAILPLDKIDKLKKQTGIKGVEKEAKASYERTMEIVGEGLEKAKKELIKK